MTTQQLLDQLQTQLQKAPAFTHDIAGLYLRLSVEKPDERSSTTESQSIETQRDILIEHCQNLGIEIYDIYVDDGETGTNFKRSGFEQMIQDLEAGKINTVVCNDLSRFARNYKEAGYYIDNYFPEHNVRFIAKVDNVDRRYERMDIGIAIRNMMNEHYAHDVSRKTRAAKEIRAKSGKFIGSKPAYGYKRDPDDRHHLIVDEEAAGIVRWIFQMASTGAGYNRIARTLRENGVLNPESYTSLRFPEYYKKKKVVPSTKWHVTSVQVILQNPVYTGIMAQNRVGNITTKGKTVKKPVQDWIVVDNTHEALVDKETWSRVQEQIKIRRRATKDGKPQKYAGLLYCSDCGAALSFSAVKRKTKPDGGQFKCWQYLRHGNVGIIWIDAHPDVTTAQDGYPNAHAMVLGSLMGYGDSSLSNLMKNRKFGADEILYVGLQQLHDYQETFLKDMQVDYKVQTEAFVSDDEIIEFMRRFDHILIHLDIDVLDASGFHATYFANKELVGDGAGSGKMTMDKLTDVLECITGNADVVGFTIAEYLPFEAQKLHNMFSDIKLFNE